MESLNDQMAEFGRTQLKEALAHPLITEGNHLLFKRMYAHGNIEMDINDVVDQMEAEKLNTAMDQVQRTIKKYEAK
jgi:hypothetical protein